MTSVTKQNFIFYPMVESLELILGSTSDLIELIKPIDRATFLQLRAQIIDLFNVEINSEFTGEFGEEVEFGDVSDAVRETTFSLYPQSTDMLKPISYDERLIWCKQIIEKMDAAANRY